MIESIKLAWAWLKTNWKYVVTFGIPIVISWLLAQRRTIQSQKKAIELKDDINTVEKSGWDLEQKMKLEAQSDKQESLSQVDADHKESLEKIKEEKRSHLRLINTPEEATRAILDKLRE